jgi:hypothetical protein
MFGLEREDGAGIGKDVAPLLAGQNHCEAGFGIAVEAMDGGDIDARVAEPAHGDLSEAVGADAGGKADLAAERCQVMGHDRRGTAQREHHLRGQQFALRRQRLRQTIQNQVEIQFTGNGNVETGQNYPPGAGFRLECADSLRLS